jgi:hypothetical protein
MLYIRVTGTAMCGSGWMYTKTHILLVEDRRHRYDVLYCGLDKFAITNLFGKVFMEKSNRKIGTID